MSAETVVEVTGMAPGVLMTGDEFMKQQEAERDLQNKKNRANVRVFEKVNCYDQSAWGQQNPVGAKQYLSGMNMKQAEEFLKKRIQEGVKKFAGPAGDAEILFSRVYTAPGRGKASNDGWLYSEAYYASQDVNMTIRSIVMPDGTCFGY